MNVRLLMFPCTLCWLLLSGCAFADVKLVMAEPAGSLPANHAPELAGKSVCISQVEYKPYDDLVLMDAKPDARPDGYDYQDLSAQQWAQWGEQLKAEIAGQGEGWLIGFVRNGYGMKTADVITLSNPGHWFVEALKLELEGQGGRVVAAANEADVAVKVVVRHVAVDLYMTTKSHLLVDVTLEGRSDSRSLSFHAYGTAAAWWGNASEYYAAIRDASQQVMWRLVPQIARSVQAGPNVVIVRPGARSPTPAANQSGPAVPVTHASRVAVRSAR